MDEFDDYINKLLSITPRISSTHNLLVNKNTTLWGGTVDFFPMKRHLKIWNQEDKFPHDPGTRIICQLIKYLYIQETSYMKMESKYCIMGSINQDKQ